MSLLFSLGLNNIIVEELDSVCSTCAFVIIYIFTILTLLYIVNILLYFTHV